MTTLTVSEARASLPDLLTRVQAGHEITITRHGVAVAVLVRPDVLRTRRAENALAGAEEIHDLLRNARSAPISTVAGMTEKRAQELVEDIRTGREAR